MAAIIDNPPVQAPHYKLTVEDYHRMGEVGILGDEVRTELIEGELIEMPPIGCFHAGSVSQIADRLMRQLSGRAIPWIQCPIRLSRFSEPQPDFALLKFRDDYYKGKLPGPADVLLAVEVADSSVRSDRAVKAPLYARHGIPEYWLIDLPARAVEVYQDPAEGRYRQVRQATEGGLAPCAFPDALLDLGDLLA